MYESEYKELPKDKSLKDIMGDISDKLDGIDKKKIKKFRMPLRSRVSKRKLRQGYITVVVLNENKMVDFRKEPIVDGTFKLDDTIHAVNEGDIFLYKGKPLVFQAKKKINPYNPLDGEHETYGLKTVANQLEAGLLTKKKKMSGIMIMILIVVIIGGIYYFTSGGL